MFIGCQRQNARSRLQMRPDQIERTAMQRYDHRILQRPTKAGGCQTERGRSGENPHFGAGDPARQRHPGAEEEGIAGCEHHDGLSAQPNDGLDGTFERA